ncbi:ABC transporter permease subunit [Planctomonas psychrotolerans]|uniref:ABC transporter permease subunit n=1 Tax=Planctomonas psychrotolerans TaxID=2528712 RepID=UPI00123AAD3A|nr:ABC transporter permease subunit [Planctomonas psychrotolerans]
MTVQEDARSRSATRGDGPPERESHARGWRGLGWGFLVKLLLMALVNAIGLSVILGAVRSESWFILGAAIVLLVATDVIYFTKRALPLKYMAPGLIFLLVFQIFSLVYTGYVAFTNYGSGHSGSQAQAVQAALIQAEQRVPDSPSYPLSVVSRGDELGFAIADSDGDVRVGTELEPLSVQPDAEVGGAGAPTEVPGWTVIPRAEVLTDTELQQRVTALRVPVSDDPEEGSIRTRDGTSGAVYLSSLDWDPDTETLTETATGKVYSASDRGSFVAEDGSSLPAGWSVPVGFENFVRAFTDTNYAAPLLQVTVWTFAFAILTTLSSFGLGLLLAIIYNDSRVRGRKLIRTLFILPYAFPVFMSALLWRGMLNPEFGIVNDLLFFGADLNWFQDPTLARFAVLWVNLWLSFPYWFLVCTGALQALPADTLEAAEIDGAGRFRRFRSIMLPLLLVSTAPLAIASFAFSFNNFTLIYLLTGGGPNFAGSTSQLGATDLLINAVYQISGVSGGSSDYGLASALSIIIFIVIGAISAVAFRQTRKLEEMQ